MGKKNSNKFIRSIGSDKFINNMRDTVTFKRDIEELTACFALSLHEYTDINKDDINIILCNAQSIWTDCIKDEIDPLKLCEEKTELQLKRKL